MILKQTNLINVHVVNLVAFNVVIQCTDGALMTEVKLELDAWVKCLFLVFSIKIRAHWKLLGAGSKQSMISYALTGVLDKIGANFPDAI